jgi:hypothetical protein
VYITFAVTQITFDVRVDRKSYNVDYCDQLPERPSAFKFGASVSGDKNPVPNSTRKKVREGLARQARIIHDCSSVELDHAASLAAA